MTHPQPTPSTTRPDDVDTGFWIWVVAVPLMAAGYVVDVVTMRPFNAIGAAMMAGLLVVILVLVVTFLILMRQGYRWARTVLTAGGAASIVSVITGVFAERPAWAAVVFAVTGIVAAVLIAGGIYQLHRKESNEFFVR